MRGHRDARFILPIRRTATNGKMNSYSPLGPLCPSLCPLWLTLWLTLWLMICRAPARPHPKQRRGIVFYRTRSLLRSYHHGGLVRQQTERARDLVALVCALGGDCNPAIPPAHVDRERFR